MRQSQFFEDYALRARKKRRRRLWVAAPATIVMLAAGGVFGYRELVQQRTVVHDRAVVIVVTATPKPYVAPSSLPNTGTAGLAADRGGSP